MKEAGRKCASHLSVNKETGRMFAL